MGRQWNQIIESLGPLTGGTMSINANLTDIEALLATLQADVADGIIVSSGTVLSNLRDGSGNAITSTTSGASRRLDVMLSSGGTTGSTAPTNANLVGGTDGTNLRAFSTDTAGRVNVNPVNQSLTVGTGTASGASASGTDLLASTDVSGFAEASVQFTNFATGAAVVQPQVSNDGLTWVNTTVLPVTGSSALAANTIIATGLYRIAFLGARYFRIRVSTNGTGGTYDFAYTINPRPTSTNIQSIYASAGSLSVSGTISQAPVTGNGHSTFHTAISAAGTNATNVKGSNSNIAHIRITNTTSSIKYFKLFNSATAPTVGTSTPVLNYAIEPNSSQAIDCGWAGIRLSAGLSYAITSGQALLDTTAVGAGDVVVNIAYV